MKKIILVVFLFNLSISAQIEKYLTSESQPSCSNGPYLIGMPFVDEIDIEFTLEDSERRNLNNILAKSISKVKKNSYTVILPKELEIHKRCVNNEFILLKLVSYKEVEVGGFERTGTIEIEVLIFKNPTDSLPQKTIRVTATGESDYGHSNPLEYAVEEAAKKLRKAIF
jgi:hypothetical protein